MARQARRQAPQMTVAEMAPSAAAGGARALAARQAAGGALSSEELSQVTGGARQTVTRPPNVVGLPTV